MAKLVDRAIEVASSEERLRLAIEVGQLASWDWDLVSGAVTWNDRHFLLQGYDVDEVTPSFEAWLARVHPDDRAEALQLIVEARDEKKTYVNEFRMLYPDGTVRWASARANFFYDAHGQPVRMVGVMEDITDEKAVTDALRKSEENYRSLFEAMDEAFALCELVRDADGQAVDYRYIELNSAVVRQAGISPETLVGRRATEVFGTVDPWLIETYSRVVEEGQPVLSEHYFAHVDRWLRINVVPRGGDRFVALYSDVSARYRAETALRESEARQAFLLRLADALRLLNDDVEIEGKAARLTREHLDASWCYYNEFDARGTVATVMHDSTRDGLPSMVGVHDLSDLPEFLDLVHSGNVFEAPELADSPLFNTRVRNQYSALGMRSGFGVPVIKNGRLTAVLVVADTKVREWKRAEIDLVRDVAERVWIAIANARAESALRESEERFRQFSKASSSGLWMRDAATLNMEYVSPAVRAIYGVAADEMLGDITRWAALIVPEDRETALDHLEKARAGTPTVHEFRILRPDGSFRWIRNTDFPLLAADGKIKRIGGIAEDMTEAKQAVEHQGVLLHELQHRVRNIMAMLRSVANRSASGPGTVEEYRTMLEGRLLAIARVQALLTREANAGGSLRDVLQTEIGAMAHGSIKVILKGPEVKLSPKAVEVLSLAFHELATNALKYGALSSPTGKLSVTWQPFEKRGASWLAVDWIEQGSPTTQPSGRRGFGSELIEGRIPYELGGTGAISIGPGGAACHIEFPLAYAESILDTDAPSSATIFGGTLDMTGAPDLDGQRVLVVEDDYYAASDTAAALRGAGAEVLGPCPSEEATLKLLESEQPTAAVVDLNLGGGGPQFNVASALRRRGIPFVFLTGYDPEVIPPEMADVARLQKPLPLREVVEAVSRLADRSKDLSETDI